MGQTLAELPSPEDRFVGTLCKAEAHFTKKSRQLKEGYPRCSPQAPGHLVMVSSKHRDLAAVWCWTGMMRSGPHADGVV